MKKFIFEGGLDHLEADEGAAAVVLGVGADGGGVDEDGQDGAGDGGDGQADEELDEGEAPDGACAGIGFFDRPGEGSWMG